MEAIKDAIKNLYEIFALYTTEGIHHCDCGCIDLEDVKKLHSKPLPQLEEDDLVSYHGSALHTWGEVKHYKHFLPRVLELKGLNRKNPFLNLDEIYYKLVDAKWQEWPEKEQEAIRRFALEDWKHFIKKEVRGVGDFKLKYFECFFDKEMVVTLWEQRNNSDGLRDFVNYFYYHGISLLNDSRTEDNHVVYELIHFIKKETSFLSILEETFFEFEEIDPAYAQLVSVVLQRIEFEIKKISEFPPK